MPRYRKVTTGTDILFWQQLNIHKKIYKCTIQTQLCTMYGPCNEAKCDLL